MAYDVHWVADSAKPSGEAPDAYPLPLGSETQAARTRGGPLPSVASASSASPGRRLQPGDRCASDLQEPLRINCSDFERGTLLLEVRWNAAAARSLPKGTGLVLCAGKAGDVPDPNTANFHWVSQVAPPGIAGLVCRIQTHSWVYANPDIIVLPILSTESPQPHPEALLFTGVDFQLLPDDRDPRLALQPHAVGNVAESCSALEAALSFQPEVSALPTQELRWAHAIFYDVYSGVDGLELSAAGKEELGRDGDMELTYGEVNFFPFWKAMQQAVAPRAGEIFVDLGSGTGRAVLTTALAFPELQKCLGLEVIPNLHLAGMRAAEKCAAAAARQGCRAAPVELRQADFLETSWVDADIIWVSSLCLGESTLQGILQRVGSLRVGARIATMDMDFGSDTDGLERITFDGFPGVTVEMSFGEASMYVLRRI